MSHPVSDITRAVASRSADELLEALDPEQRAVATALHGPVVVMAGAGTGKTRAITHRIAYGVRTGTYDPVRVLAVTFTQRAAGEMREQARAGELVLPGGVSISRSLIEHWYGGELPGQW